MSINPLTAAETAGTVDAIKSGTNDVVQWLGRGVTLVTETLVSIVTKIYDFVGPALSGAAEYIRESFAHATDYIQANRDIAVPAGVAAVVAAFASIAGYVLLCGKNEDDTPKAKEA